MTPEALDTLEITQLLEEVKHKLTSVEENQGVIIGHLEALEAMLGAQESEDVAGLNQRYKNRRSISERESVK